MPVYLGTDQRVHRQPERIGVLLVNLGTPEAPTPSAVRRYLSQFLSDPRVIETPRWLWWLILHGVILRIRPRQSAHAYAQVWTEQGSPLLVNTQALADKLCRVLRTTVHDELQVEVAMTYGKPGIRTALDQLRRANVRRLLVLPLYPQYSGSTTGSVFDAVTTQLQRWRWLPELRFITQYHDEPAFISALVERVRSHWQHHGRHHLVLSFHGLPKRYLLQGDPYFCQCHKTARLVAAQLALAPDEWSVSFQSRVGREEWLRPYTDQHLLALVQRGIKQVTVMCPAFAVDCLETLEEIALRNAEDFRHAGGEVFDYVPALNDADSHIEALRQLVTRQLQGWPSYVEHPQAAALARAQGASD